MNREQRIKQLEEKVDEMINNLSKVVERAVKDELQRIELRKMLIESSVQDIKQKSSEGKAHYHCPYDKSYCNDGQKPNCCTCERKDPSISLSCDEVLKLQKGILMGIHEMPNFMRATKLSPPSPLINCPYDGRYCNQFGISCLVCEKHNPSAFKVGEWIRYEHEKQGEKIFRFKKLYAANDALCGTEKSEIYPIENCKKWEPRYEEKIIAWNGDRYRAAIMLYEANMPPFKHIIPFISIEQYDKIIKGE